MKQRLGIRRPAPGLAFDQQAPDLLGAGCAAGLARGDHGITGTAQRLRQKAELRGLAAALPAFERDEFQRQGDQLVCGSGSAPKIICSSMATTRPPKPSCGTSAAATSGARNSGMPGICMTSSPTGWPAVIGAGIGLS